MLEERGEIKYPAPPGGWVMSQHWNDLLFAHWPMAAEAIAPRLPAGLEIDQFQGSAWLGVVPFSMDRVKVRGLPAVPGLRRFPELNLRTYVRDRITGTPGVYFFSLEAANPFAVMIARGIFQLPYHWARMNMTARDEREIAFYSRRLLCRKPVVFSARYRGLGPTRQLMENRAGSIEYFLTERYCLFTRDPLGRLLRANIQHAPWTLEQAEAEIDRNDLIRAAGLELPAEKPLLHYSRHLAVYVWAAEFVAARVARAASPVAAAG
uniref:DUF2071 domain-containing protein n=1 Tax=mine drainage metagenome TaxID=410659 RepID=E6QN24_9ZZZZ